MRYATALCVLVFAAACGGGSEKATTAPANQPAPAPQIPLANLPKIEPTAILDRIKVLASDEYEGRAPGTKGEELTVQYLETELKKLGLKPGNTDGTYIQKVPLVGITAAPAKPLTIAKGGSKQVIKWRDEMVAWTKHVADSASIEDSDLIFAGYGVEAPEFNWDDFKGVDVKGKTIIVLVNDPAVPDPIGPPKARSEDVWWRCDDVLRPLDLQVRGRRAQGRGGHPRSSTKRDLRAIRFRWSKET